EMVAHLKAKQVVIVNLENAEPDVARQIIDFLSGAVYALEGSMRKIKEFVFVVSPNTVEITAEIKRELQERTNPFWGR
ncbi:MAG: cell division protein SepF, partial [bacterium]